MNTTTLTVAEAARELRCSPSTIRRWVRNRVLKAHRIGATGRLRFTPEDLRAVLVPMAVGGTAQAKQVTQRIDRIVREVRAQQAHGERHVRQSSSTKVAQLIAEVSSNPRSKSAEEEGQ